MFITIIQDDPMTINLQFNPTELEHPLFQPTLTIMKNNEDYIIAVNSNIVTVQLVNHDPNLTGSIVDDLRELWCGDVYYQYDENEHSLPKDLSNCPCFVIGE